MERPSKLSNYMEQAEVVAKRSHDAETIVGSILVSNKSGAVLATGFNGFVRGTNDKLLPRTRPDKHKFMVHSEENLVANCAKHGISMDDCTLICTHSPCIKCMRLIFQCGITRVIIKNKYRDFESLKLMEDIHIEESQTPEGYFELTYVVKTE